MSMNLRQFFPPSTKIRYSPIFWRRMFALYIQSARERLTFSIEFVASLADMKPAEWSAIEAGEQVPAPEKIKAMAEALEMTPVAMAELVCFCDAAWDA